MNDNELTPALSKRLPTKQEAENALDIVTKIIRGRKENGEFEATLGNKDQISLSSGITSLFLELLGMVSRGELVTLIPFGTKINVYQAANILNVSRQFIEQLMDQDKIKFEEEHSHRLIYLNSLLDYKRKNDALQQTELNKLVHLE